MGKITIHHLGLCTAAEKVASGHPSRRSQQSNTLSKQDLAIRLVLFMGDAATDYIQHFSCGTRAHSMPTHDGLLVRLHCSGQHLHVHFRCHQVIHDLPFWTVSFHVVYNRCAMCDAFQCRDRKRGSVVGTDRQKT